MKRMFFRAAALAAGLFVAAAPAAAQEGGSCAPQEWRRAEIAISYVPLAQELTDSLPVTITVEGDTYTVYDEFIAALAEEEMGKIGERYIRFDYDRNAYVYTPYPLTSEGVRLEVGMVAVDGTEIPLGARVSIIGHAETYVAADLIGSIIDSAMVVVFLGEGNAALARAEEFTSLDSGSNTWVCLN